METKPIQAAFETLVRTPQADFNAALQKVVDLFRQNIPLSRTGESTQDVRAPFNQLLHGAADDNPHSQMCRAAALYTTATTRRFRPASGSWPTYWRNLNDDAQGWCRSVLLSKTDTSSLAHAAVTDLMAAKGYMACITDDFRHSELPIVGYELDLGILGPNVE